MKAQLAKSTNTPNQYINSDHWGMQQKIDGQRLILECGEQVQAYNRKGDPRGCPSSVTEFFSGLHGWTFDGELIGEQYYVFDLLEIPTGNIQQWPLIKRYELLEKLRDKLYDPVILLPMFLDGKAKVLENFMEAGSEGVMFKRLDAPYENRVTSNFLKYKFINQVDCVIIDEGFNGKDNFVLGLWNGSEYVDVGKCSSLTGDGPSASVGDVVTVNVLYVTDSNRLYQAVKPTLRNDKDPQECLVSQLEEYKTNREILC